MTGRQNPEIKRTVSEAEGGKDVSSNRLSHRTSSSTFKNVLKDTPRDTLKDTPKDTPMMKQYHSIKKKYRDSVLLFRLGDFYEMFEDDALEVSRILNITLTKRNSVTMCGFPYHAADTYISKLLKAGKKIAICEQVEDPKLARGIVKRDVVEVLSPGMVTRTELLDTPDKNSIMAIFIEAKKPNGVAVAICDISTGYFYSRYIAGGDIVDELLNEIENNGVREIAVPETSNYEEAGDEKDLYRRLVDQIKQVHSEMGLVYIPEYKFSVDFGSDVLKDHFDVASLDVFEFDSASEIVSAGALLDYLRENVGSSLRHIRWIERSVNTDYMVIDNPTRKHLELTENQSDGSKNATLYSVLDNTKTSMGSRLLKWNILNPIISVDEIEKRLDRVEFFVENQSILEKTRKLLSGVLDIERIVSKISVGRANARDLVGLKNSLLRAEELFDLLADHKIFEEFTDIDFNFSKLIDLISSSIVDEPPVSVKEGGIIKDSFNDQLDEYRRTRVENRDWIKNYQNSERERLGIPNLRVRYNKVIGYYIEITKANLSRVPENYIRKQTLVNSERFTTEELELHESKLMEAREKSDELEYSIFMEICSRIVEDLVGLYGLARSLAWLDYFQSLAVAAVNNSYTRPRLTDESVIDIEGGRHPVIELFSDVDFIDNDLMLNNSDRRIMILTGPNMAGKSTYLRQNALIILMAHIGSYVPARRARIGTVDRIFSRIGMSDRLIKGESTFLVEMIETSRILHYATDRSFIIMDEIGRGTSTFDGLSIAWAVLEYLLSSRLVGCKVLFATHYHEITAMDKNYGIVNYNVTVKEWNNRVIFLRKVVPGCASKSYGVEVARMAGLPDRVIERAREILAKLEKEHGAYISLLVKDELPSIDGRDSESVQLELFPSAYEIVLNELKNVDINNITPLEALNILDRLKKSLNS